MSIIGRPNVGKSSLLNALLGEERAIVSDADGTTRDAIDTSLEGAGRAVRLVDTAGIKRRGKVASGPAAERFATLRALKAVSRADVAVLVIDAMDGLTAQDAHVAGYAVDEGIGLVLAINKWDLVEDKTQSTFDEYVTELRRDAPFLGFAPIVSISAKTGQRVERVLEAALEIAAERRRRIPTAALNAWLREVTQRRPPATVRGKQPRFFYATQVQAEPPTFVLFANGAELIHFSYRRYLENRLREAFGFHGTPLRIVLREREREDLERRRSPRVGSGKATGGTGGPKRGPRARGRAEAWHAPAPRVVEALLRMDRHARRAVVGAGAWGTTLALHLAKQGPVVLLARDEEQARALSADRCNKRYLPDITIPVEVEITADASAVANADEL